MLSESDRINFNEFKESLLREETARKAQEEAMLRSCPIIAEEPQVKFSLDSSALEGIRSYVNVESKREDPFHIALSRLILLKGFTKDSDFYKKCGLTRQAFSKMMGWRRQIPRKKTVMAMSVVLKLTTEEAEKFLARAGYALTHIDKTDLVIRYCLEHNIYDLVDVNEALMILDQRPLLE